MRTSYSPTFVATSRIHVNLYKLILAWVYGRYRVPDAMINRSGGREEGDRTMAVGHGTESGDGTSGRDRKGGDGPAWRSCRWGGRKT